MEYKGQVIVYERSQYTKKAGGVVVQDVFTCMDAHPTVKMKDSVDVVVEAGLINNPEALLNKVVTFNVHEIRPGQGQRLKFNARSLVEAK